MLRFEGRDEGLECLGSQGARLPEDDSLGVLGPQLPLLVVNVHAGHCYFVRAAALLRGIDYFDFSKKCYF